MPITKSALKALRQDKKRTLVNHFLRSRIKTVLDQFHREPTKTNLDQAYSILDKAAKKQIIHDNKASRLKAGLSRQVKIKKAAKK